MHFGPIRAVVTSRPSFQAVSPLGLAAHDVGEPKAASTEQQTEGITRMNLAPPFTPVYLRVKKTPRKPNLASRCDSGAPAGGVGP